MKKTRINLDIVLPEIPSESDKCTTRLLQLLHQKKGIDKVHIIKSQENQKAQLCFHYDPEIIDIHQVENLAKKSGATLTERYGHLLIQVSGIRHPTHARIIESGLKDIPGIIHVSVSGTGFIQLEYDKHLNTSENILAQIQKPDVRIIDVDDFKDRQPATVAEKETIEKGPVSKTPIKKEVPGHAHGGIHLFGQNTELIFAIICGVLLAAGFGLSFAHNISPYLPIILYIGAYFFGGFYTTQEAMQGIIKGHFEIDFLMLVAAIGAAVLGEWAEGALLLFLFSLGHSLEHYAMNKAKKSIEALAGLAPKTALLKQGEDIREVDIEELKTGDIILVRPNSKIAADGMVISGNSSVNEAPITGESMPVDKQPVEEKLLNSISEDKLDPANRVFAGTINGGSAMEIRVTKIAEDFTVTRLVKLVREAQTQKSPTQNFTDRVEKYYVPSVLILVVLLLFAFLFVDEPFSASFYRAMAVLVAASPCALAISTPSAILSGIARAARSGVLVKGGKPLEDLGSLTAIAFDKTGTLTEGKPKLTGIYPFNNTREEDLLETVIAVEKLSDHPLAAAIVKGGTEKLGRDLPPASDLEAIAGRGIKATYKGEPVHIGNKELITENIGELPEDIRLKAEELEGQGNTTMIVHRNHTFMGLITLMDVERSDSRETLSRLRDTGIRRMIMLTGDNQKVAEAIAEKIGITEAWGNLLPEQKVEAIEKLKASEKQVAMVGDGVNDAPAMAKSTVGIAMGAAGSDVALETADIALMADKLINLPFAIGLSRKARRIIRQNVVISLGMVAILVPLTISGVAAIGPAVIGHEGSTLIVVFNALRLLAYK